MLKLNDGGDQESEVARPFVVWLWCGIVVVGGIVVVKVGCKVRERRQVKGRE